MAKASASFYLADEADKKFSGCEEILSDQAGVLPICREIYFIELKTLNKE